MAKGLCFLNGVDFILSSNKSVKIAILNEGDPLKEAATITTEFDITNSNFKIVADSTIPELDAVIEFTTIPKITLKGDPEVFLRFQNGDIFFLEIKIPIQATKVDHGQSLLKEQYKK